jgi:hypothetical protein
MGTLSKIRDKMDDTELVVQQLTAKLTNLKDDILLLTTDLAVSAQYMKKGQGSSQSGGKLLIQGTQATTQVANVIY